LKRAAISLAWDAGVPSAWRRADDQPCGQVAEHGAEPEPAEQRNRDDRRGEKNRGFGEERHRDR
jgi:hypothetical protein